MLPFLLLPFSMPNRKISAYAKDIWRPRDLQLMNRRESPNSVFEMRLQIKYRVMMTNYQRWNNPKKKNFLVLDIAEVFDDNYAEDLFTLTNREIRIRLNWVTENINVVIRKHSKSPHKALRFIVGHSAVTNEDEPALGYKFGLQATKHDVTRYVLYCRSCG